MIIKCVKCKKNFSVDSQLIPDVGRTIQCGTCNHVWFYKKNKDENINLNIFEQSPISQAKKENKVKQKKPDKKKTKTNNIKSSQLIKYEPKTGFTLNKFLSYILVLIISFAGLIIFLDTFKKPLYNFIPNLELLLFNLFETLKDIKLFLNDLT